MTAPVQAAADVRVLRGHAAMIGATLLVATSFPVGAAITHGLDSVVLTLLRFALAAVLFLPIIVWRYGFHLPGPRDLLRYSLLSACLVGFFWGMFVALRFTSPLNTAAIFALTPVLTALLARAVLGARLGKAARVALPLGMLGALWVVFRGDIRALLALDLGKGDAIFFAATLAMAFYSPLIKRLHKGEPMAQMTFWTLVTGSGWLLLLAAPRLSEVEWHAVSPSVYAGIAYLAVLTTLITFFTIQWCTTVIGPTKVMSYTYLNPLLVALITLALGAPALPWIIYPGFALTIAATVVLQRDRSST